MVLVNKMSFRKCLFKLYEENMADRKQKCLTGYAYHSSAQNTIHVYRSIVSHKQVYCNTAISKYVVQKNVFAQEKVLTGLE